MTPIMAQTNIVYTWWAGMVLIRVKQGCDSTRVSPHSPYFIDDRINKITTTNITDHRSYMYKYTYTRNEDGQWHAHTDFVLAALRCLEIVGSDMSWFANLDRMLVSHSSPSKHTFPCVPVRINEQILFWTIRHIFNGKLCFLNKNESFVIRAL